MARQRRPSRAAASQEYNRSCQGNTGRHALAANPGAQAVEPDGPGYHTKEFINQSISDQGQRTGAQLVAVDVDGLNYHKDLSGA